jgi:hypothetical protein
MIAEPAVLAAEYAQASDPDDRGQIVEAFGRLQAKLLREVLFPGKELREALAGRAESVGSAATFAMMKAISAAATTLASDADLAVEIQRARTEAALRVVAEIECVLLDEKRRLDALIQAKDSSP